VGEQELLAQISAVSPRVDIRQNACSTPDEVAALLTGVDILFARSVPSHLDYGDRLKWVQLSGAGIDGSVDSPIFDAGWGIVVTSAAGVHAVPMAEYCLTVMSMLPRGFLQLFRDQQAKVRDRSHIPTSELWGRTVGIVGYGHIGREVARLASAHYMHILAYKRNPEVRQNSGYQWQGVGDPEGSLPERFFGPGELHTMLGEADFVLNCLPSTPETCNLFGNDEFRAMRESAYFINVGRGRTVNEDALVRALRDRVIAGAALDVLASDSGPLPADHPLWELDNVFLSPHISGTRFSAGYRARVCELFCANLRRYLDGEPLYNIASRERGY